MNSALSYRLKTLLLLVLLGGLMACNPGPLIEGDAGLPDRDAAEELDTSGPDATDPDATDSSDPDATDPDAAGPSDSDATGPDPSDPDSDTSQEPEPCQVPERVDVFNAPVSASWRFGGGTDYPDFVAADPQCMTVVSTAPELIDALAAAQSGDIVYVADDARIDLTDHGDHCIPGGVWLAGGRGINGAAGGLLYAQQALRPMLKTCGDSIRVTGLRFLGNDPNQCPPEYPNNCPQADNTGGVNCRDCTSPSIGVIVENATDIEFDNNEMAGWAHAAIYARNTTDLHIHHNDIHHTQRQGLGYGVVLMRGGSDVVDTLVEHNRFDYNRHAIAGSGERGQSYIARNNLVERHANGHVFDMHGSNENVDDGTQWAGTHIEIYDNTVLVDDQYTMVIRGRPEEGAWLYDNCLAPSGPDTAALQRFYTGSFHVDENPAGQSAPNQYGQGPDDCERERWCFAPAGAGPWTYGAVSRRGVQHLALGDFNGDGVADVFTSHNDQWRVVYGASGSWQDLNNSNVPFDQLVLADFTGDGKTDIFNATGSQWRMSAGATGSWQTLRSATESADELLFGDFTGDGKTDVFHATGSQWRISPGGTGAWQNLNSSSVTSGMAVGDFNGDGVADIFRGNGSTWQVSYGGTSSWENLISSGLQAHHLLFGDFTGDGITDVIRPTNDRWRISQGANSSWETWRISTLSADDVLLGDITGDGKTDVFTTGCH